MHRLFMNVGYELSEQQLRPYFANFGAVTDVYLPKHVSGRNKGYGFLTYATESALLSVVQQPKHAIDGKVVQVNVAGPRPVRETKSSETPCTDRYGAFGRGHRLYVGGLARAVTQERVEQHFAMWGDVLDVYFPAARGLSTSSYCFITFGNYESAQQAYRKSQRSIDGWPLKSISMAEDRKDVGPEAPPKAGKIRSSGPLEISVSAKLQMPSAPDTASLSGYVSWLELQYQEADRQLATVQATNVPAGYSHSANLPQHSHICSQYPLGLESGPHGANTNQVYQSAPAALSNSLPTNRAAGACQNWNGMFFPLPGSSVEYTGEMEGFVAGLGSTDTSLNSDYLAMLVQQSMLEASGQFIGGEDSIPLPSPQEQCFDGRHHRSSPRK